LAHYLSSDIESAREAASQALKYSYRLSETSKFLLKANRYIFDGDYDRAERVVEIWTQVQPNSTDALQALAFINTIRGTAESLQRAIAAYDRLLEINPRNFGIYLQKAEVEEQRGNYAAAAGYLRQFLEQEPASGDAHLQLAGIYQALGDLEAAQASLEDAAILSDSPVESEIGLARLEARRGYFKRAQERLAEQLNDELSSQQRGQVLSAQADVAFVTGQIETAMALLVEINEIAKDIMPPMVRLISIEGQQSSLLFLLGKTGEAIAKADEITAQLQAPVDSYMYFSYLSIYEAANDLEAYREWMNRTLQVRDQLPPVFEPFIEMHLGRLAIWDEDFAGAITHLDRASELLGQSLIQVLQDNLSTSSLHITLAELYLEANAIDNSRERVDAILKVFPANGHAKLVSAKLHLAQDNEKAGREALAEALEIWSDADADYIYSVESRSLINSL
jgi:tetratricopeptide (TPR) repeat protein